MTSENVISAEPVALQPSSYAAFMLSWEIGTPIAAVRPITNGGQLDVASPVRFLHLGEQTLNRLATHATHSPDGAVLSLRITSEREVPQP